MQAFFKVKIEKYEEDNKIYFVATSDEIQGLVAEGSSIEEVVEIARDLAKILLELEREERGAQSKLPALPNQFEYPIILEV